jgi:hypothetical protein
MPSSKSRGHFRKKPGVVRIPERKEKPMEKTTKDDPMGPPPPAPPPPPGDPPAEEPTPSRPPHWHEGDVEPKEEGD